jgi:hypothetical protein
MAPRTVLLAETGILYTFPQMIVTGVQAHQIDIPFHERSWTWSREPGLGVRHDHERRIAERPSADPSTTRPT